MGVHFLRALDSDFTINPKGGYSSIAQILTPPMFKVLIRTGLSKRGKENLVVRKDLDSHIQANEAFIEGLLL